MILGKNYWCADSPGLHVCKSASLQVCKSASLQVCKSASLQSASVAHRASAHLHFRFSDRGEGDTTGIWSTVLNNPHFFDSKCLEMGVEAVEMDKGDGKLQNDIKLVSIEKSRDEVFTSGKGNTSVYII